MTSALIVIDMLNPYEHQDAEPLMESVEQALPAMRELIEEAPEAGLLTVYVNDNHGDWTAGREKLTQRALAGAQLEVHCCSLGRPSRRSEMMLR